MLRLLWALLRPAANPRVSCPNAQSEDDESANEQGKQDEWNHYVIPVYRQVSHR
jgi:hypothetical protein